jgi:hypothetical protein
LVSTSRPPFFCSRCTRSKPTPSAQVKIQRRGAEDVLAASMMRACSFSNTRGTPVISVGCTRGRSRETVSIDSANVTTTPSSR